MRVTLSGTPLYDAIAAALKAPSPFGEADVESLKARVKALADKHPLYPGLNGLNK